MGIVSHGVRCCIQYSSTFSIELYCNSVMGTNSTSKVGKGLKNERRHHLVIEFEVDLLLILN